MWSSNRHVFKVVYEESLLIRGENLHFIFEIIFIFVLYFSLNICFPVFPIGVCEIIELKWD